MPSLDQEPDILVNKTAAPTMSRVNPERHGFNDQRFIPTVSPDRQVFPGIIGKCGAYCGNFDRLRTYRNHLGCFPKAASFALRLRSMLDRWRLKEYLRIRVDPKDIALAAFDKLLPELRDVAVPTISNYCPMGTCLDVASSSNSRAIRHLGR